MFYHGMILSNDPTRRTVCGRRTIPPHLLLSILHKKAFQWRSGPTKANILRLSSLFVKLRVMAAFPARTCPTDEDGPFREFRLQMLNGQIGERGSDGRAKSPLWTECCQR
jgi:hypothetical protein